MQLTDVVNTSAAVSATTKRGQKTEIIARALQLALAREDSSRRYRDAALCVAYLSGQVRQARLGVGYATVAALSSHPSSSRPSLTLAAVDDALQVVATTSGSGATQKKLAALGQLFANATGEEQRFLSALLSGELRQGALEGVLLDAVAMTSRAPLSNLRSALLVRGDFVEVAATALTSGIRGLETFRLTLFQPLSPMLAQPAEDAESVLNDGPLIAEFKLDGARIQIHKQDEVVRAYSRQLNDVTSAVPEIVDVVSRYPARQLILDGEALALKPSGKPFPFQDTMRRFGRKKAAPLELQHELPLSCFLFDCLHADGTDVFSQAYSERQLALDAVTQVQRVERSTISTVSELNAMFTRALAQGHEGLVLKTPDSSYEPGRRGSTWLKLKPVHTLDLVVLAAEWGSGRRKGTLSNLHLGARSEQGFVMLGKTFKGLTDALLAFQTQELLARETHREAHVVHVRPELVVEVAFDGVQRSSQYPGGVALRFARVKRYRADKLASQADTIEQVLLFLDRDS